MFLYNFLQEYTEEYNLGTIKVSKRNHGYILKFGGSYEDEQDVRFDQEELRNAIDELPGCITTSRGCTGTIHLFVINQLLYDTERNELHCITDNGKVVMTNVSEEGARIIANRLEATTELRLF